MTIQQKVQEIWGKTSALTTLIPVDRVKPPGNWVSMGLPYAVHFPVSESPTITYGGLAALRIWDFYQISVFADSYSKAEAVVETIRQTFTGTIDGCHFSWIGAMAAGRDPDVPGLIHIAAMLKVAEALAVDSSPIS